MTPRTSKVEAIASHLLDGYLLLREKVALLEPMLFDQNVVTRHGQGFAGRGFNTLRHTLFLSCVQDIAKLCKDADARSPSIYNVVRTLRDGAICKELRNNFSVWAPPPAEPETDPLILEALHRINLSEQAQRKEQFDELHVELESRWEELNQSAVLGAFRQVRDRVTAHTEIRQVADQYAPVDISSLGIRWNQIGETARRMERLVELCGLLVRNASFAWEALDFQLSRTSSGFWLAETGAR
ncbi:hypothetical protein [Xanthomonas sacchari]|uniref:AbiU2 domain-containing protein n=1 Tax=Xanthomonas sacchari TaxID=56458 RepID=UPI003B21A1C9